MTTTRKKSLKKKTNCDHLRLSYLVRILCCWQSTLPMVGVLVVKLNTAKERFLFVYSSSHQNGKCGPSFHVVVLHSTCSTLICPHSTNQVLNL